LTEGIEYPRTYSFRTLLEILSKVVSEDKKAIIKGVFKKILVETWRAGGCLYYIEIFDKGFHQTRSRKLIKAVKEIMKKVT